MSLRIAKKHALAAVRGELGAHLNACDDPCMDRDVEWPCDVARALLDDFELADDRRASLDRKRNPFARSHGR